MQKEAPELIFTKRMAQLVEDFAKEKKWINNRGAVNRDKIAKAADIVPGTIYSLLGGDKKYALSLGNVIKLAEMMSIKWIGWLPEEEKEAA